jgi:hypothetical protein
MGRAPLSSHFESVLAQMLSYAEHLYDQVIRRWGNVPFAQSSVYEWVWSDDFRALCLPLDDLAIGQIRLLVMDAFGVKPWPWCPPSRMRMPPADR